MGTWGNIATNGDESTHHHLLSTRISAAVLDFKGALVELFAKGCANPTRAEHTDLHDFACGQGGLKDELFPGLGKRDV